MKVIKISGLWVFLRGSQDCVFRIKKLQRGLPLIWEVIVVKVLLPKREKLEERILFSRSYYHSYIVLGAVYVTGEDSIAFLVTKSPQYGEIHNETDYILRSTSVFSSLFPGHFHLFHFLSVKNKYRRKERRIKVTIAVTQMPFFDSSGVIVLSILRTS